MDNEPQTVILLISDSLFREGLKLLLEDMHFSVSSSGSYLELEKLLHTYTVTPALLIFPMILNNGKPAIEFVRELRDRFNSCIPVILLRTDSSAKQPKVTDPDLTVLPEQVKPKALRQKINEIFNNRQVVSDPAAY